MEHFVGVFGLVAGFLCVLILSLKYSSISDIILLAFTLRVVAALVHFYVFPLPDGGVDATGFEGNAWKWGQDGLSGAMDAFVGGSTMAWTYSHVMSFVYVIFGRSPLLLQVFSVVAGVYTVVLVWKLSILLWERAVLARGAALICASYPILILYSALTLREVFISMFLVIAMIYYVKWHSSNRATHLLLTFIFLAIQLFLHPGVPALIVIIPGLIIWRIFLDFSDKLFRYGAIEPASVFQIFSIVSLVTVFLVYALPLLVEVIGYERWLTPENLDVFVGLVSVTHIGSLQYPEWLIAESILEYVILAIPRLMYFLFSPFPWQVSSPIHLLGLLDSLFFAMLFLTVYFNRKVILSQRNATTILLIIIALSFVYSVATGNAGTGMRHRSKMLPLVLALAGPFLIHRFRLSRIFRGTKIGPAS